MFLLRKLLKRRRQSALHNIYHCTVQKSASQWVRGILSDPRTFRHSGLMSYQHEHQLPDGYDPRGLTDRTYADAFPDRTIVTPLYLNYEGFAAMPKRTPYRAFFVMRDPRDVVVSWYFSVKYSHRAIGEIGRLREELLRMPKADGLIFAIDYLNEYGLFEAQHSWAGAGAKDANVLLVRCEDLVGPEQLSFVKCLLAHCDIRMPDDEIAELVESISFEKLSGRMRGHEDVRAHYRKGIAGDWRNHFDDAIHKRFSAAAGDVITLWGYQ